MTRSFSHKEARQMSDALFAVREVAQECDMRNRVVEPDPMWISAVTESMSTLGRKFVDRIRMSYETLDNGGGESKQFTRGLPRSKQRDPLTGQQIVKCDPTCKHPACATYRAQFTALFGSDGDVIRNLHCSGCLECTLMDDGGAS
jgi:hypothetical protein